MDKNALPYYPNTIKIEFTQGCNRHCKFCGTQGIADVNFLQRDTLEKILYIVSTANRKFRIELGMHGEPLLNPNTMEYLAYIKQVLPKCFIQLITNGDKIRDNAYSIKALLEFVDDLAMDVYDEYDFDKIKAYAKQLKTEYPNVSVEIMQNGVSFYAEKKKGVKRILLIPPLDLQSNLNVVSRTLSTHCGAGIDPKSVLIKKDKRCHMPFRQLAFRYDGNVCFCCDDFRGELPIVNVMDKDVKHFADVWWHPRFNAFRRILFHEGRHLIPCSNCNARGNRLGLLPDPMGKLTLRKPSEEDYTLWKEALKEGPLAKIRKREWEKEND